MLLQSVLYSSHLLDNSAFTSTCKSTLNPTDSLINPYYITSHPLRTPPIHVDSYGQRNPMKNRNSSVTGPVTNHGQRRGVHRYITEGA
jgi:hypothetical protein